MRSECLFAQAGNGGSGRPSGITLIWPWLLAFSRSRGPGTAWGRDVLALPGLLVSLLLGMAVPNWRDVYGQIRAANGHDPRLHTVPDWLDPGCPYR